MAYPTSSARVALQGATTGGEIFETTFGVINCLVSDADQANTFAGEVATHFTALLAPTVKLLINADSTYTGVRSYHYPTGGNTAAFVGAAVLSTTGTGTLFNPLQQSAVCTLLTGFAGRRNRGRMYFPANGVSIAAGHIMSSAVISPIPAALASFFQALEADTPVGGTAAVISTTGSSGRAVTQVRMDVKPDIQRRRANKQAPGLIYTANV